MSKISSNEVYDGNITRKTIDYFCHLLESPEDLRDIQQNDTAFAARKEFEAIRWAASKVSPIYRTSYTDILRVAFTYKFNRGKLADLVSLLSGRDFENREFKIEIEEQSFYQLHEAVLQAVNQTNYERYLMIVRSAGIVRRSLDPLTERFELRLCTFPCSSRAESREQQRSNRSSGAGWPSRF